MTPDYSIIIPAWNEAELLPRTLAGLKSAMRAQPWSGEIIVADNNSTDATGAVARDSGARVVFEPENNIARARNAGARAAAGAILIFVDADTLVGADLLHEILTRMKSGRYYASGAAIAFDAPVPWPARAMTALWNRMAPYHGWAAGCCLACPKELFDAVGGFPAIRYAGEELHLCRVLRRIGQGRKFSHITAFPAVSSARKMQQHSMFRLLGRMFLLGLIPALQRSKSACSIWYKR